MKKRFDHDTFAKVLGIMVFLALMALITGCAKPKSKDRPLNPLSDAKVIGKTLGCVFAPASCKEQQAKDEKDFVDTFKKLDAEKKADQDKAQPASK